MEKKYESTFDQLWLFFLSILEVGGGRGGGGVDVSGVENVTLLKLQLITYKCTS